MRHNDLMTTEGLRWPAFATFSVTGLVLAIVLGMPHPAAACSTDRPPTLDEILVEQEVRDRQVTGVFEVEHIAFAPTFFVRTSRSVSVVTRYWGEPPPDLGRVTHGEYWLGGGSSCGNGNGDLGDVIYSWSDGVAENRGQFSGINVPRESGTSKLSAQQEAALVAAFGPAVDVGPSLLTSATAWAQIWWLPALLGLGAATFVLLPLRRHVTREVATLAERFFWPALALGLVIAVTLPLVEARNQDISLRIDPSWTILLLIAVAAGVTLSRPIAGIVVGVAGLIRLDIILDGFGETPFRGSTFSADRLHHGVILGLLGLGLLAAAGRHWARWPGAVALIAGAGAIGSAVWPVTGRISWWLITPTTLAATSLALWFAVFVADVTTGPPKSVIRDRLGARINDGDN